MQGSSLLQKKKTEKQLKCEGFSLKNYNKQQLYFN